jgi:serine/threonine protein kinase
MLGVGDKRPRSPNEPKPSIVSVVSSPVPNSASPLPPNPPIKRKHLEESPNSEASEMSLDDYLKLYEGKTFEDYVKSRPSLSHPSQGGTARVFTVKFALKKVKIQYTDSIYNEIRALTILNESKCNCSPRLISVVKDGDFIYEFQSYTDGKTLEDWLKTNPLPGEKDKRKKELDSALTQIHKHGIIHADIKPSNIWIPSDPMIPAYFIDFGSAIMEGEKATSFTTSPNGSPLEHESANKELNVKALNSIFMEPKLGGKHKSRRGRCSRNRKKLNKTRRNHKRYN